MPTVSYAPIPVIPASVNLRRGSTSKPPLAGTLADYLLPGTVGMPAIKIGHLHPDSAHRRRHEGYGRRRRCCPPAAIANAVRDALSAVGAEVNETPITPRRVLAAIARVHDGMMKR